MLLAPLLVAQRAASWVGQPAPPLVLVLLAQPVVLPTQLGRSSWDLASLCPEQVWLDRPLPDR